MPENLVPVKRALLSVSDKSGLPALALALAEMGVELLSTGGTAKAIADAGLRVRGISDVTGYPEMMDGRVKTLHPALHGGLLALRDDEGHRASMAEHGIGAIDLLVVSLYPFEETVAAGGDFDLCIENIDIGGPAMIRSAAKNHRFVTVVTGADAYGDLLDQLRKHNGATTSAFRRDQALKAFGRTAAYDAAISGWMAGELAEKTPDYRSMAGSLAQTLRYGENPHQQAALYRAQGSRPGVVTATQRQGKALSYNNINDTDAAFELVAEFDPSGGPACAIIKHANPCGVARGETLTEAYCQALACDRTSAFGGIVAFNRTLDEQTAREVVKVFTEVVIAPDADDAAMRVFEQKKALRLLTTGGLPDAGAPSQSFRQVAGGFLVQDRDNGQIAQSDLKVVSARAPTPQELDDMMFAWKVAKHVKSNAIVYVRDGATVGIGAGQMSRVDSARIAARKAEDAALDLGLESALTHGSVVASDAFFPFADGLMAAVKAGATAVIQPGGSMRDDEVIRAADDAGLAMVFTGMRHFRH